MTSSDDLSATGADPTAELMANFARTARSLFLAGGVEATLRAVVNLAVATIEGCSFAGVFVLQEGRVTTAVGTGTVAATIDDLQLREEEGPCLDAIALGPASYAEDLAQDPRWPNFGPEAAAAGVRSLLALRLSADHTLGALNLYGSYPAAFGPVDQAKGLILAGLGGVALSLAKAHEEEARLAENLHQALTTRELVGQAQGILMERERITGAQAFDILRRASQHLNIKLREVAQELIDTGQSPKTGLSP